MCTSAIDDSRAWVGDWSRKLARRSGVPALCSLPELLLVRSALRRGLTARGLVVAAFGGVCGFCESSVPRDRNTTGDWSDHWSDWAYGCILEPSQQQPAAPAPARCCCSSLRHTPRQHCASAGALISVRIAERKLCVLPPSCISSTSKLHPSVISTATPLGPTDGPRGRVTVSHLPGNRPG